jgi:hypothetical protein
VNLDVIDFNRLRAEAKACGKAHKYSEAAVALLPAGDYEMAAKMFESAAASAREAVTHQQSSSPVTP